jgi:hypothetical protein
MPTKTEDDPICSSFVDSAVCKNVQITEAHRT